MNIIKGFSTGICLFCAVSANVNAQNDCYFRETKQSFILGNSRIEIRIDPVSGVITGLLNKSTGIQYLGDHAFEVFRLVYSTWEYHSTPSDDPWSAAYGTTIKSSVQKISSRNFERTEQGAIFQVTYDRLYLEKRTIDITLHYTIEVNNADEEIKWRLFMENRSQGIIREAHFPFISGLNNFDALIMPNESG